MDNNKRVIFDYISSTMPEVLIGNQREQDKAYEILSLFKKFLKLDDCQIKELDYATNNFKYQFELSDFIILRCGGPYNESGFRTCQFEMKGEGCREFERLRPDLKWKDLFYFLIGMDAKFKRVDATIDDLKGNEIKIEDVFNKIKKGFYTSIFKSKPKYFGTLEDGLTISLGTRQSQVELCIYDKLSQQRSLNKECNEDYWTRYEMRFRGDKANAVIEELLDNYEDDTKEIYGLDLASFASKSLYRILDIKEDNNYSLDDQRHVATDLRWNKFLNESEKGILPKTTERRSNLDSSYKYIMPKAKIHLLLWFFLSKCNSEIFEEKLYADLYELAKNTSKAQFNKLNQFLLELGKTKLSKEEYDEGINKLLDISIDKGLPI